jgi:putative NADH-flavin reductase
MTIAVIGATGRVGSEIVGGVLARGDAVTALVRDPGKGRRAFGEPCGLHIRPTRLDDPRDLTEALDGIRTVFIAMGSIGIEGVLQRIAINAAARIPSIEQVTRLSVLNTSAARTTTRPAPSSRLPAAPHAQSPSSFTTTARNSSDARVRVRYLTQVIWGPGYRVAVEPVTGEADTRPPEEIACWEAGLLAVAWCWFAGIRSGDDAAIAAVLARDHPVCADHPQITLNELTAMIVGLRRDRG